MKNKEAITQAHMEALYILIEPYKECGSTGVPIDYKRAIQILNKWDKARKPKKNQINKEK